MTSEEIVADADAADVEIQCAADLVLDAADGVSAVAAMLATERPEIAARLDRYVAQVLQACAFRDMVGQRLARIAGRTASGDPLANGPVNGDEALDQAAVDALLET